MKKVEEVIANRAGEVKIEANVNNDRYSEYERETFSRKSMYEVIQQRHLDLNNENIHRSYRDPVIIRENLSKRLKQTKPKLSPDTPEKSKKSEIFQKFEKFKLKREQKVAEGSSDDVEDFNSDAKTTVQDDHVRTSVDLGGICLKNMLEKVHVPNDGACVKTTGNPVSNGSNSLDHSNIQPGEYSGEYSNEYSVDI